MSRISWRHDGRQILLPVHILRSGSPSDLTSIEAIALIDTGATASGIDVRLAGQLDLRPVGKRPLQSAHGLGHVDYYMFRIGVRLNGSDANSLPYVFADCYGFGLPGMDHFQAIIGMDILRQCDLNIHRDGRCELDLP